MDKKRVTWLVSYYLTRFTKCTGRDEQLSKTSPVLKVLNHYEVMFVVVYSRLCVLLCIPLCSVCLLLFTPIMWTQCLFLPHHVHTFVIYPHHVTQCWLFTPPCALNVCCLPTMCTQCLLLFTPPCALNVCCCLSHHEQSMFRQCTATANI